jgi:hypothetical protein
VIRVLLQFYDYYGNTVKVECPTGSGRLMNLFEVAREIVDRLTRIFLRDERGRRPVYGGERHPVHLRPGPRGQALVGVIIMTNAVSDRVTVRSRPERISL